MNEWGVGGTRSIVKTAEALLWLCDMASTDRP